MNELMSVISLHVQTYLNKHVSMIVTDICSKYNLSYDEVTGSIPAITKLTCVMPTKRKIVYEAPPVRANDDKYELVSVKPTKRNKSNEPAKRSTKKPGPPTPEGEITEPTVILMNPPTKRPAKTPVPPDPENAPVVSAADSEEATPTPTTTVVLKKPTKRPAKTLVPPDPENAPVVSAPDSEETAPPPKKKKPTSKRPAKTPVPPDPENTPVVAAPDSEEAAPPPKKKPTKRQKKTTIAVTEDVHANQLPTDEAQWFEEAYFPPNIAPPPPPDNVYLDDEIEDDIDDSDNEETNQYERYVLDE